MANGNGRLSTGYALARARLEAVAKLNAALPEGVTASADDLEVPPQREMGDLAYPCFALSKVMKSSPADIARQLAVSVEPGDLISAVEESGPYINFWFDRREFGYTVMEDVLREPATYGDVTDGGERMIIEYASPNTHKELHVGHLRNLALGLSAVRLARAAGNSVAPVTYIGDVGAHVAKCLWAYRKFYDGQAPAEHRGSFLGRVYTEATRRLADDESLKEEVSAVQTALESGDPEWTAVWQETRQWCLDEFMEIFAELGSKFDRVYTESEVEGPGKEIVRDLLDRGIAETSEGAVVVNLEGDDLGFFLILKSDGNSLYSTKELALAKLKFSEFEADVSVHIVDTRQSHYFRQFFRTLELMGFDKRMVHLAYEFVTLKEGAMSSREGNVVTYESFRDTMLERTRKETSERHRDWSPERTDEVAWAVAEGAMKFGMLKQDNDRAIVFDVDQALSFDGFTGPYVQYAHARMCSILKKVTSGTVVDAIFADFLEQTDADVLRSLPDLVGEGVTEEEYAILRKVAEFPSVVAEAAAGLRPSLVAQYAFELAQAVGDFYRDVPVLNALPDDRDRRLAVVRVVRSALARSLYLLGMEAPEEM